LRRSSKQKEKLVALVTSVDNATGLGPVSLSQKEFNMLRELIFDKSGISLHDGKMELVRTRLGSRLRELGFSRYHEYYEYVKSDTTENELVTLLDAISTNLTSFFRENKHFEFLEKEVLPAMIQRKQKEGEAETRFWSAGCSSGEEPYTLAITLMEQLASSAIRTIKILATDISTQMLSRGAAGVYSAKQIENIPKSLLRKYFDAGTGVEAGSFVARPELKSHIQFRRFNLMTAKFPFRRKFDVIFCRNVMIYFDKPTQQTLVNKYYDVLAPGGYLLIGHSESLTGISHRFKYVQPTIYHKQA